MSSVTVYDTLQDTQGLISEPSYRVWYTFFGLSQRIALLYRHFIRLLQSNNCNLFITWMTCWEVWNPAETAVRVVLTVRFLPRPYLYLLDMWWELNIQSPEEQFLSTQCCCHSSTLWHTGSHCIIIVITSIIIFLLHFTLRKIKPFLRCHYTSFRLGSMAFWSCMQLSPWSSIATINAVQPPAWPSQEPSDLDGWTWAWWSPLS